MKRLNVTLPFLYTVTWAIHPILFLAAQNIHQIHLQELFQPLLIFGGVATLFYILLQIKLKNSYKTSFLIFLFWIMIFIYAPFSSFLKPHFLSAKNFLILWIIFFSVGILTVFRSRHSFEPLSRFLSFLIFSLCFFSLGEIALYHFRYRFGPSRSLSNDVALINAENVKTQSPDIYYIILDRYAGWQTLRDVYQWNNLPFLTQLQKRGFYVATQARANYLKTAHSLASSLNLEYLDTLSKQSHNGSDWTPIYAMIQRPKVWDFLKARGYEYIHLGSWWEATRKNPNASLNINRSSLSEFLTVLYGNTLISALVKEFPTLSDSFHWLDVRREHYERIRYQFEQLATLASRPGPKFVFSHFIVPHVPYVFDAQGNYVTREETMYKSKQENYRQQLQYVNQTILAVIDRILAHSPQPPVILLQSDEGPLPNRYEVNERFFNWKHATDQELKEKFEILSAYYCPNVDLSVFYPEITPVNSFRLLFNLYFGTQYTRLPDECFAFENEQFLYDFFSVTEKINLR